MSRDKAAEELSVDYLPGVSNKGRLLLQQFATAYEDYINMGATYPEDHGVIEYNWNRARRELGQYVAKLERKHAS